MKEENRKQMIAAMETISKICAAEPCNIDCPLFNNCFFSTSPAWWDTKTSPLWWEIPKEEQK